MDLRDTEGRLYRLPPRRLRRFLVPEESVARLRERGPGLGPEDLASAGIPVQEPVRFLMAEGRLYAVPARLLRGFEVADSVSELLERGRLLVEEGNRLLRGEAELQPTDLASLYPVELARPHVARVHAYYSSEDPFSAFFAHREAGTFEDKSFTYGQTAVPAIARALDRVGANPSDRFLDLGCGCGAAVLAAAGPCGFAEGVDLVPPAIAFCRRAAADLGVGNVDFRVDDGRRADLSRATVIYLAATAFSEALCQELEDHLQAAPPAARVISVSRPFRSGRLEPLGQETMLFSWTGYGTPCPVEFYYQRVATTNA